jgi:propanol-preferring alcohol dehydrogenase
MLAYRLFADGPRLVEDAPKPTPAASEVLVKIAGAGACHSDLHVIEAIATGKSFFTPPFTLGHENTGWIEELGPDVRGLSIGDAVAVYCAWGCGFCRNCLAAADNYCENSQLMHGGGLGRDGGMATHMLVPSAKYIIPLGDLEPIDAAPLTDAGLTSYAAIKRSLNLLTPDSTTVVFGIGGLGHMALQVLRAITSAHVIAVDTSEARLAAATELGAHEVYSSGEQLKGRKADVVFDFVGVQATIDAGRRLVRANGDFNIVGLGGGTMPYTVGKIAWGARVSTPFYGSIAELRETLALAAQGKIHAHTQRFTLDRVGDAYKALHAGTIEGRAVITPNA